MALNRGQELNRGKRRTLIENPFGVVQANTSSLGQIGGKLSETAEKITLFQADIMDKEWQNDFDKNASLFISEETRKELNSPNPDIVGLQQKLLTYKDKILQEAPNRFANYVTNKLDLSFAENINLVTDYANDLKYTNLLTQTQQLESNNLSDTSNYIDQVIKNNAGDIEKINSLLELHYQNVVTPNINRIAKNYESLNKLKPLKVTPADIESKVRLVQIDFMSEKFYSKMKAVISSIDFDDSTSEELSLQLTEANKLMDEMIQEFVENPESRDINNLSDSEVEQIRKNWVGQKEQLLNFENTKIKQADIAEQQIIGEKSEFIANTYAANSQLALNSNLSDVMEIVSKDDYLYRNPNVAFQTIESAMRSINVHKSLYSISQKYDGKLPEASTLKELIKQDTDIEVTDDELIQYRNAMIGVPSLTVAEYMDLSNVSQIAGYGVEGDGKTPNQVEIEKNNLFQLKAFEYQLKQGNYPKDTLEMFAKVDGIINTSIELSETDEQQIQNTFAFYRLSKQLNPAAFYEKGFGEVSDFFLYLDKTRGELYLNTNITDIESVRGLYNEYRENVKKGFDFDKANQFIQDNDLTYGTTNVIQDKIVDDARTAYGGKALLNWMRNKLPEDVLGFDIIPGSLDEEDKKVKTTSYTDLFGVSEFQKFAIGITKPMFYESKAYQAAKDKIINLPPNVEEQINSIYVMKLNKLVDFNLMDGDTTKLKKQIEQNQELALELTIRQLRDDGFGVSKYESKGPGLTLAYQPIENKMIYQKPEDQDMYIAVHFYNRIKDMTARHGPSYMLEHYPNLFYENYQTDQENKVEFDLNRAYELAIERDGVYLTRLPGTDVYRYNLDENVFNGGGRYELDGDIDEEQYFRPDDVVISGDQLISNESIIGGAIKKYIAQDPTVLSLIEDMGVSQDIVENIFYRVMYPGVKLMTSEEEIMDYIQEQSVHTYGLIK